MKDLFYCLYEHADEPGRQCHRVRGHEKYDPQHWEIPTNSWDWEQRERLKAGLPLQAPPLPSNIVPGEE